MMCALLKTVLLNASVMIVITDVCDAIISSCPSNHSHHLKIDCFVCFLINFCRWLNYEDPLINHNLWTVVEDKNLLLLVQDKGINNWFDIAVSLGTNRTPFQCLARYQRSLNASILRREWTKDEDAQLCAAVDVFGESDWQSVASTLEGRTGTQCSNRLVSYLKDYLSLCLVFAKSSFAVVKATTKYNLYAIVVNILFIWYSLILGVDYRS